MSKGEEGEYPITHMRGGAPWEDAGCRDGQSSFFALSEAFPRLGHRAFKARYAGRLSQKDW